jgi:hypothetical protein
MLLYFDFQSIHMTVPTPPGSNKPAGIAEDTDIPFTKLKPSSALTRSDPTGNLPHDQLAKMFPTPPSHEHNLVKGATLNLTFTAYEVTYFLL